VHSDRGNWQKVNCISALSCTMSFVHSWQHPGVASERAWNQKWRE